MTKVGLSKPIAERPSNDAPGDPVFPEKPKAFAMKYIEDFLFTHPMFEPAANSVSGHCCKLIDK